MAQRSAPRSFRRTPPKAERHRHRRKYATGELGEDKSFYFRGPDEQLNLRAQNLMLFLQIGDGVDDETWLHHLRAARLLALGEDAIKNDELAAEIERIERDAAARRSRAASGSAPRSRRSTRCPRERSVLTRRQQERAHPALERVAVQALRSKSSLSFWYGVW